MDVVIKSTHHISMNKIDISRGRMVGTEEACPPADTGSGYSKTFPRDFLTFLDFLRIVLVAIV